MKKIFSLSEKRINYLHNVDNKGFYKGHQTYLDCLQNEIKEAQEEMRENNCVYLEDELGDIFWDYICLIHSLEQEKKVNIQKIFERCYKKFSERVGVDGHGNGDWQEIKQRQKEELFKEHNLFIVK